MKIFIGAESSHGYYFDLFTAGDAVALVGEKIKKIMDEVDYRIFNLELALTDKETPIKKAGPNIGAPTSTINAFKALGVDLLGISNNHVLDHGYEGSAGSILNIVKNSDLEWFVSNVSKYFNNCDIIPLKIRSVGTIVL